MKKHFLAASVAVALGIASSAALAASLANLSGQSCGDFTGTWHFVNNQIPAGSGTGTMTATWTTGSCVVQASKINSSTQHFYCTASGTLTGASTNLGGKLVLSDFSCDTKCEIDPKTNECVK
jgi:hypothetical protein